MGWLSKWFEPKPYNCGYLPPKDGHEVFFMEFGNPQGLPVIVFHGGPGGRCSPKHAAIFNLKRYRVILFDQRGCKRSLPLGELKNNTTQALLEDTTRLLNHLKIKDKVILRGGSWGSTLALLWAIQNPQRVERLLLSQIFLADKEALRWENSEAAWFYPEFVEQLKNKSQGFDIPEYFDKLISSGEAEKQLEAANTYGFWERVRSSLNPRWNSAEELSDCELAEQRIYIRYAARKFWLEDEEILDNLSKIKDIPTVIVHNRLDFVCPLKGAYEVHKALPRSRLVVVPDSGHVSPLLYKTIKREFRKELV